MKILAIYICAFLIQLSAFSQTEIKTRLMPDSVLIGQPTSYIVSIELASLNDSSLVTWLIPKDSLSSGLEIIDIKPSQTKEGNQISKTIRVRADKTGFYPINPFEIRINQTSFYSEAKLLSVFSTIENPQLEKIRDIKESTPVSYSLLDFLADTWHWILLAFLFVGAITFMVIRFSKLNKKLAPQENTETEVVKIPPYEIALQKLKEVEIERAWSKNELKKYHSDISYLLREYLEGELNLSALESTTPEILLQCQNLQIPNKERDQIKNLLSLTDLVKFAKQLPSETENLAVLESTKEIIMSINKSFGSTEN